MKKSRSPFKNFSVAIKIAGILMLSMSIADCASSKRGYAVLKAKRTEQTYQRYGFENPSLRIEKDLSQDDFQDKLRNTMDGNIFKTNSWSSNCDCR